MITIERLDHIQVCIPIGAEDQARQFYTGILGFKEISKPEALIPNGGLWYQVANIQLHIGVENEINHSKRHPAFQVKNLEEARKHLVENGVRIKEDIAIPGMDRFSFFDPFDNRFEFLQYKAQ
ncbi:VOC family protein [Mucilaginibacter sp. 21P]|uniref:VOC family protein n=1 Tax=Mucilaginibacter sp. 21P TaxID=2778902 RepID=UPI001C581932|nr:VOC family protein [Mucilaginibacter sp. 21P]QXV66774.1 VOC family protein [Mucilaginibacter sp. 21P]